MNYLRQTSESYNEHYKAYRADWCRKSGLPMYAKKDFEKIEEEGLYTTSRACREDVKIDNQTVVAWYRLTNGYTPLFKALENNKKWSKKIILSDGEYEVLCKLLKSPFTEKCPALEDDTDVYYFKELRTRVLKENDTDDKGE